MRLLHALALFPLTALSSPLLPRDDQYPMQPLWNMSAFITLFFLPGETVTPVDHNLTTVGFNLENLIGYRRISCNGGLAYPQDKNPPALFGPEDDEDDYDYKEGGWRRCEDLRNKMPGGGGTWFWFNQDTRELAIKQSWRTEDLLKMMTTRITAVGHWTLGAEESPRTLTPTAIHFAAEPA